jgi:hypothetical protein
MGVRKRVVNSHKEQALQLLPRLTDAELRFILTQSGSSPEATAGEPQLYSAVKTAISRGEIDPSAIHLLFAVRKNGKGANRRA